MIDKSKLKEFIDKYKIDFTNRWPDENYKWEAVKCFQDNWDIKAPDFADMLERSLAKTSNLLVAVNYFPARMIKRYAEVAPEEVREMFRDLFDEEKDVITRILNFKKSSDYMQKKYANPQLNSYQRENAISIYLWLRYPEKYYIYKFGIAKTVAGVLDSSYEFKQGEYAENLRNFYSLYDELCEELQKDEELKALLASKMNDNFYPDKNLCTLMIDFGFYIYQHCANNDTTKSSESSTETVQELLEIVTDEEIEEIPEQKEITYPAYTKDDFLEEVYMPEENYAMLTELLEAKYNIILQGAPGVGKTFAAKRLAYSIMGKKDTSRVAMIQFHQSYSYEDFIQGYRPVENGFKLESGAFYKFCKAAEEDNENLYFFIIDEINRGNLSKILGELMMLIEKDKRGEKLKLLYSNEWFTVPENVRIIGMMNTADRSLAMMDYALRRRFAFFDFAPAFANDGFLNYIEEKDSPKLKKLISVVESLNTAISNDESLGDGFRIGHSYFCTDKEITDGWLRSVVEYEVIPLLKEYWFDEPSKVRDWSANLRSAIK